MRMDTQEFYIALIRVDLPFSTQFKYSAHRNVHEIRCYSTNARAGVNGMNRCSQPCIHVLTCSRSHD